MEDYEVVVMLGDNLNDFSRDFYPTDLGQREDLVTQKRDNFGRKFVFFLILPWSLDKGNFWRVRTPSHTTKSPNIRSAATANAWRP